MMRPNEPLTTDYLSPKQVGLALGVSEASVKRWCDQGKIASFRTAGGHRRVSLANVLSFLRDNDYTLANPEVLGFPAGTGKAHRNESDTLRRLMQTLEAGDLDGFRRLVLSLYVARQGIRTICDEFLARCFEVIGERWEHGELEIYVERRACGLCARALTELLASLPESPESAPLALGATLSGDHYDLALQMGEVCLRESGWQASVLGTNLPADTIAEAVKRHEPAMLWISISHVEDEESLVQSIKRLYEECTAAGARLVIGGRALSSDLRSRLRFHSYGDSMDHLVAIASAG